MTMPSDESLLARLRHRYHDVTTPTHVERAPGRERWKRQAWMVGSTLLSLTVTIGPLAVAVELGGPTYESLALATLAYAVVVFVLIDRRLFQWGLDRFDLTLPWQFREAEYESLDDGPRSSSAHAPSLEREAELDIDVEEERELPTELEPDLELEEELDGGDLDAE